jgi:hypothetical protein
MSSWDKNARRKGEKAGSVWEKKSKKCVCFVTSHHERNTRRRITVTSSFSEAGRKNDGGGGRRYSTRPTPVCKQTYWRDI